jgi:hypothetical protein
MHAVQHSSFLSYACSLTQSLGQYRTWLEEERRVSSDPVKHQAFLAVSNMLLHYFCNVTHVAC